MNQENRLRAVYWDLGGVLLRTEDVSHRVAWGKRFDLGPWELERLVFRSRAGKLASVGKATVDDVWLEVQEQLGINDIERETLRVDFFAGDRIDDALVNFIRRMKQNQIAIGLISNAWPDTREWLETHVQIADIFDHMVISWEIGMAKPDPRVYQLALEGLQMAPEQSLFVDDFIENVDAAKSLGMMGIHFQDPQAVMHSLSAHFHLSS